MRTSDGWLSEPKTEPEPIEGCDFHAAAATGPRAGRSWFQEWWEPCQPACANRQRLGPRGDGGKWVCMDNLQSYTRIVSIGSNNDFRWETDILRRCVKCTVDVYDPTSSAPPARIPRLRFHKRVATPADLAQGHPVGILKIDCEGCEVPFFRDGLEAIASNVDQVLVELHWRFYVNPRRTTTNMWREFYRHRFVAFAKEPNIQFSDGSCIEYALQKVH